jgi:hypothetical protein
LVEKKDSYTYSTAFNGRTIRCGVGVAGRDGFASSIL